MSQAAETRVLLRELYNWLDDEHVPLRESGETTCEACGLPWPCPPGKVAAFFDEAGQCVRCYNTAAWRNDQGLLCEPCRARSGLSKRDLRPLVEQLAFGAAGYSKRSGEPTPP